MFIFAYLNYMISIVMPHGNTKLYSSSKYFQFIALYTADENAQKLVPVSNKMKLICLKCLSKHTFLISFQNSKGNLRGTKMKH